MWYVDNARIQISSCDLFVGGVDDGWLMRVAQITVKILIENKVLDAVDLMLEHFGIAVILLGLHYTNDTDF